MIIIFGLISAQAQENGTNNTSSLKPIKGFEGGKLYKVNNLSVLDLSGNYTEMGRQEGGLLKDNLSELYKNECKFFNKKNISFIYKNFRGSKGHSITNLKDLKNLTKEDFDNYPPEYKDILMGMSETSNMTIENISFINDIVRLNMQSSMPGLDPVGCSAIAVWGVRTSDGQLIFGRNFDWAKDYRDNFSKNVAVTIYNPIDGNASVASVGYIGSIEILTGMNSKGLFIELNNGGISNQQLLNNTAGNRKGSKSKLIGLINLTGFLFHISSLDTLVGKIELTNLNWPCIVSAADASKAYSFECLADDNYTNYKLLPHVKYYGTFEQHPGGSQFLRVHRRDNIEDGLLVVTNHFTNNSWSINPPKVDKNNSWTSTRLKNLIDLSRKYSRFTVTNMEAILDTLLWDNGSGGGATRNTTDIQVIAIPKNKTLYVKVPGPGYDGWNKVNLTPFFPADPSEHFVGKIIPTLQDQLLLDEKTR